MVLLSQAGQVVITRYKVKYYGREIIMEKNAKLIYFIILSLFFGILTVLILWDAEVIKFPPVTPTSIAQIADPPNTEASPTFASTLPPIFQAVAKDDTTCYFGTNDGYDAFVTIPQYSIVSVLGKDTSGQWMLVRLEGFADCWIHSTSLQLMGSDGNLPLITTSLPPVTTPVPSTSVITTQLANQTPSPSMGLTWKVLSFDCYDGKVTRVLVDLNVSGGILPYSYSQQLPMYAKPEQVVSITVKSSTQDGEPSNRISFPIPRASDFKCDKDDGSNTVPPPPIITPTTFSPPIISTPVPACRDGIDNDGDGNTDYPKDQECGSPDGNHETP